MKNFVDLVQPMTLVKGVDDFSLPGQQQHKAAQRFEQMVLDSGLFLWSVNRKPQQNEKRLVVGVNTASQPDMALLDALRDLAVPLKQSGIRVEVFNVYFFQTPGEFEARIAGLGAVYHTPVAGIWEAGQWIKQASSGQARHLIHDYAEKSMRFALQKLMPEKTASVG